MQSQFKIQTPIQKNLDNNYFLLYKQFRFVSLSPPKTPKIESRMTSITTTEKNGVHHCCYQAYQLLHFGFTVLPIIAGLDKFFNFLVKWDQYLAPDMVLFGTSQTIMMIVGIIEIIAGVGVWIKPRIFSYVVAAWLLVIILNLLLLGKFFDVALRDFGLLLGALALARLSCTVCVHKD